MEKNLFDPSNFLETNVFKTYESLPKNTYNPANFEELTAAEAEEPILYGQNAVNDEFELFETAAAIICEACQKKFTTKSSLKRHLEKSVVCHEWVTMDPPASNELMDRGSCIVDFMEDLKTKITTEKNEKDQNSCKYCKTVFSNVGNLNKHFKTATTCNRFAFLALQETFVLEKAQKQ